MRVISVTYRCRAWIRIPLSWSRLGPDRRPQGDDRYIDNTLGFKDAFFNTWTVASAKADKIGIAGSISVLVFTNNAQAIVEGGAKLNQNADWRNNTLNPHPNQDNEPGVPDADGAEYEQVVSVESLIAQQTITMTGNFSLPELPSIDPTDKQRRRRTSKFGGSLSPTGEERWPVRRRGAGAGSSIFIANHQPCHR
jgi:hypothetical protein